MRDRWHIAEIFLRFNFPAAIADADRASPLVSHGGSYVEQLSQRRRGSLLSFQLIETVERFAVSTA